MSPDFFTELLDFGALGLFAGFLVYLYMGMQKRLDALVDRFQQQLNDINSSYDDRLEKMRERYDIVINGIRAENEEREKEATKALLYHQEQIVTRLTDQEHKLSNAIEKIDIALGKLDEGLEQMKEHYRQAEIAQRVREAKSSES